MQLLYIDYTNLVLKAYNEKRESNRLSQLLMHPTAANIRQECLNVYNERSRSGEQVEENTLRAFFGVPPAGKNFGYVIERFNADKFRPLQSLVRGEIKNPSIITVELLAWLIDFTPRPLAVAQKMPGSAGETNGAGNPKPGRESPPGPDRTKTNVPVEDNVGTENFPVAGRVKIPVAEHEEADKRSSKDLKKNSVVARLKVIALVSMILAILFGGIYSVRQFEKSGDQTFGNANTGCMYWADDHYEQVPCSEETKDRLLLPLNEEKRKNFKRITQEDTITERSVNTVYYISVNGKIEYYTTGGNHPVYVTRHLKKLSLYMFDKHLRKKEATGKLSED